MQRMSKGDIDFGTKMSKLRGVSMDRREDRLRGLCSGLYFYAVLSCISQIMRKMILRGGQYDIKKIVFFFSFLFAIAAFGFTDYAFSGNRDNDGKIQEYTNTNQVNYYEELYLSHTVYEIRRDKRGRIARSSKARNDFKKSNPCPSTGKSSGSCPGFVIDHIISLKRGGPDDPLNMQWQTIEGAKLKDKNE